MLNFSEESLTFMNISLGFVMFGVALELSIQDFKRIFEQPRPALLGVVSQFLLLPALTFLLVMVMKPQPSMALGMFLVAACPGGNISNFFSLFAKGNPALSVTLTAIATTAAVFMTPLNFYFWADLYEPTRTLLSTAGDEIKVSPFEMFKTIVTLLGIPLILGMFVASKFPVFAQRLSKPMKYLSIVLFGGFVVAAFYKNFDFFLEYVHLVLVLVFLHNLIALVTGYSLGKMGKVGERNSRSLAIETGIQNSGLGLILIFNFFGGLGGMAVVAAWWGIWHMVAGFTVGTYWSRKEVAE